MLTTAFKHNYLVDAITCACSMVTIKDIKSRYVYATVFILYYIYIESKWN